MMLDDDRQLEALLAPALNRHGHIIGQRSRLLKGALAENHGHLCEVLELHLRDGAAVHLERRVKPGSAWSILTPSAGGVESA